MCSGKRRRAPRTHRSLSDYFVGFLQTDPLRAGVTANTLSAEANTHGTFAGPPGALPDQSFPYDDKYPGASNAPETDKLLSFVYRAGWWSQTESNRRPPECKSGALPTELWPRSCTTGTRPPDWSQASMVGRGRVELPTSRLSGVRSNHLSYRPEPGRPKPPQPSRRQATGARGARNNDPAASAAKSTNEGRETKTA